MFLGNVGFLPSFCHQSFCLQERKQDELCVHSVLPFSQPSLGLIAVLNELGSERRNSIGPLAARPQRPARRQMPPACPGGWLRSPVSIFLSPIFLSKSPRLPGVKQPSDPGGSLLPQYQLCGGRAGCRLRTNLKTTRGPSWSVPGYGQSAESTRSAST